METTTRIRTSDKILEASRRLFNEKGYAATSLSEIAAEVGISQGNLTYHFPAKSDLADRLAMKARDQARARRATLKPGDIAEDYVDHLVFAMMITWDNRFLLRDRQHFAETAGAPGDEFSADFEELFTLLKRIDAENMFQPDTVDDLHTLAKSIWVMSRYWMDYLREFEGRTEISWADQERGIEHHFALLLPSLIPPAREMFRDALERARKRSG